MAYAVGGILGGHFNPAVSLGLAVAGRFSWAELIPYWVAQVIGAFIAAGALFVIASGKAGWEPGGTLIHLISIPVTNTSVNPARSTSVAFYAETGAVAQLWLFWLAPLAGAVIGALIWRFLAPEESLANLGGDGADRTDTHAWRQNNCAGP